MSWLPGTTSTGICVRMRCEERVGRLKLSVPGALAQVAGDDRAAAPSVGRNSSSASICARSA